MKQTPSYEINDAFFKSIKVMKVKEKLRTCHRPEEIKEK
jgi:hypothetical protein